MFGVRHLRRFLFQAVPEQVRLRERTAGHSIPCIKPSLFSELRHLPHTGDGCGYGCLSSLTFQSHNIQSLVQHLFWRFQILKVLCETAVAVRTKAMKCLTAVVEADPAILARVCCFLVPKILIRFELDVRSLQRTQRPLVFRTTCRKASTVGFLISQRQ